MIFPNKFKIANQTINVRIESHDKDNRYGYWNDVTCEIVLFENIEIEGNLIKLNEEQMCNTFYHELIHCFQFFFNNNYDEAQAQSFTNFIREYQCTQSKQ